MYLGGTGNTKLKTVEKVQKYKEDTKTPHSINLISLSERISTRPTENKKGNYRMNFCLYLTYNIVDFPFLWPYSMAPNFINSSKILFIIWGFLHLLLSNITVSETRTSSSIKT